MTQHIAEGKEYAYRPSFSPNISYLKAKNRSDAIKKLVALFPEYPANTVKKWGLF